MNLFYYSAMFRLGVLRAARRAYHIDTKPGIIKPVTSTTSPEFKVCLN